MRLITLDLILQYLDKEDIMKYFQMKLAFIILLYSYF